MLCLLAITTVRQILEAIREHFSEDDGSATSSKSTTSVQPYDGKANSATSSKSTADGKATAKCCTGEAVAHPEKVGAAEEPEV